MGGFFSRGWQVSLEGEQISSGVRITGGEGADLLGGGGGGGQICSRADFGGGEGALFGADF